MLTAKETEKVMEKFFNSSLSFWRQIEVDERQAFENALYDTKNIKTDPFVPCGKKLDEEAKQKFIHYREMDLGRR